jgi:hypothetical protein
MHGIPLSHREIKRAYEPPEMLLIPAGLLLGDVQGPLDDFQRRLRELAEER